MQPAVGYLASDDANLTRLRDLNRKILIHHGLGEDVIPPGGTINYYTRVSAAMGGDAEVNKFMRLYLTPAVAHSSQGRTYTVDGKNDTVPVPKLPGNNNQTPTREQDQMFSALVDWVETGIAPEDIVIASRDGSVSYPVCVYPKKITWNGSGSSKLATSYSCR